MPKKSFAYVKEYVDKTGRRRYYFRRPGFDSVALPAPYGGDEFKHAYDLAIGGAPKVVAPRRSLPGSMSALMSDYYKSARFTSLRPTTATVYRNILEKFRSDHGHKSVAALEPKHVRQLIDEKAGPHARKRLLNLIGILMNHAIETGLRDTNPARDVIAKVAKSDGHATWTEEQIEIFRKAWPTDSRERVLFELALNTGQRRSDLVEMGWQHCREGKIYLRQNKTGTAVAIPITRELREIIDALPRDRLAFVATMKGDPRSAKGVTNDFHDWVVAAGLPNGLVLHGLRKATGRRLAESGCTAPEIMAILGHKTLAETQRYIIAFERERAGVAAMNKLSLAFAGDKT